MVNVDNLTALSLAKLVAFHEAAAAAMTVASHTESVRVPCGELQIADGVVTAYLEKPTKRIAASSGTYVLGPRAVAMLATRQQRWDAPDLVTALIARDEKVCAYPHDAPWIDVNDSAALAAAEQLITEHSDAFEHWKRARPRARSRRGAGVLAVAGLARPAAAPGAALSRAVGRARRNAPARRGDAARGG